MARTVDRVTYAQGQDLIHCLICSSNGWDYRVSIRRNAYVEQSHVRCEVWCAGQGWKEVFQHPIHIYPGLMEMTYRSLSSECLPVFAAVESRVLEIAKDFFGEDEYEEDE